MVLSTFRSWCDTGTTAGSRRTGWYTSYPHMFYAFVLTPVAVVFNTPTNPTVLWVPTSAGRAGAARTSLCATKITFSFADSPHWVRTTLLAEALTLPTLEQRPLSHMMPQIVYWTKHINEPKRLSRSARIPLTSKGGTPNAGILLALLCSSPTTLLEAAPRRTQA